MRTLRILETADVIAAEDTRNTVKLLNHYGIKTPLTSYHEHNKISKGPILVERMRNGETVALVTDAGMPGISDPGADLIRLAYEAGIALTVLPGASAGIVGLVLSGLDAGRFVFEGFLASEKKERRQTLELLQKEHRTMVFYEAPRRLIETLEIFITAFGESRNAATVWELTKKFEETKRGTLGEVLAYYKTEAPRGEFVIVVEGLSLEKQKKDEIAVWQEMSVVAHMELYLRQGMNEKEAMKLVAKDRGVSKREIYQEVKAR